jgi:uncharacterized protein (UPF0264 family)
MAHQFTIHKTIQGISLEKFTELAADVSLHEVICRRIPGENLEITESKISGDIYTMRREYNLDVNIPEVAKKLLKNAFRLKRTDITNLKNLHSTIELGANLPLVATAVREVVGNSEKIDVTLTWTVKVKVMLVGGMLEKHAEGEIRKFSELEFEIVEDEIRKYL